MSYHDYGDHKTRWSKNNISKDEADQMKELTDNPGVKVISPQKKLHDIQRVIHSLPENHMSMVQLSETIQKILDGE